MTLLMAYKNDNQRDDDQQDDDQDNDQDNKPHVPQHNEDPETFEDNNYLAIASAKFKTEQREERRLWESTRGNRKREGIKWVREKMDETQLPENIRAAVCNLA